MGVLVLNGGSTIGLAVVRSLGRRGLDVTVGSRDEKALSFRSKYAAHKFIYPHPDKDESGFIERITETVETGGFDVIFAPDWDTFMLISKHRKKLEPHIKVPMVSHEVLERIDNKAELIKTAIKNDIPCPKTYFDLRGDTLSDINRELTYPLIVKPNVGAGSTGVHVVNSSKELEDAYVKIVEKHGPAMVQEYIRGEAYLFNGLFASGGEPRRISLFKKLREYPITGGPATMGMTVKREDLVAHYLRLYKAFGYYGVTSTDAIVDERDNIPKLLEVNPRFFGSLAVPMAAGVDYPYLLYRMAMEGDIEKDLEYDVGIKVRNVLTDARHMMSVMRGVKTPKYKISKLRTLFNFMKFHEYSSDFIFAVDDPMPAVSAIRALIERKKKTLALKMG